MHDTHSIMFITKRPDIEMVSGEGSWLTDHEGKQYLDFVQGWAVHEKASCTMTKCKVHICV